MSIARKFLKLTSTYMAGEVIILAGGFISFPIFARILTRQEYGMMSLISMSISIIGTLFSAGLRNSSQRFYSEYETGGKLQQFYSTTVYSTLFLGVAGAIFAIALSNLLLWTGELNSGVSKLLAITSSLITIRLLYEIIGCLYRVREKAKTYVIFAVLTKYAGMLLSILLVFVCSMGLLGYYSGLIVGELFVLLLYLIVMVRDMGIPGFSISIPMLKEMVGFGFPLVFSAYASFFLTLGDRYIIGYYLGAAQVAMYSIPYNLCTYITGVTISAFQFAFYPMIMNEWSNKGPQGIEKQVRMIIRIYLFVTIPAVFGISILGDRIIVSLASSKYAEAYHILPYIMAGEGLSGLLLPLAIGLQFVKKTLLVAELTGICAVLNMLLNLYAVPVMHLYGAALVTLVSYATLILVVRTISSKYFVVRMPWKSVYTCFVGSLVMSMSIWMVRLIFCHANLLLLLGTGICSYGLCMLAVDSEVRSFSLGYISKMRACGLS